MNHRARLVVVAHGTRRLLGNAVAAVIARRAGRRLGMESQAAYVELCEPLLADVMAAAEVPTVVVPLLLSSGYHVRVDLPQAAARAPREVRLGAALGPDPLLAAAQADRLLAAGAAPDQDVVMVAAGSRDPAALTDLETAADLLRRTWAGDVRLATLSGEGPRPEEVVRPEDAVSPYLLAPGWFLDRTRAGTATARGPVADVIGPHAHVVDLVVERVEAMTGGARSAVG